MKASRHSLPCSHHMCLQLLTYSITLQWNRGSRGRNSDHGDDSRGGGRAKSRKQTAKSHSQPTCKSRHHTTPHPLNKSIGQQLCAQPHPEPCDQSQWQLSVLTHLYSWCSWAHGTFPWSSAVAVPGRSAVLRSSDVHEHARPPRLSVEQPPPLFATTERPRFTPCAQPFHWNSVDTRKPRQPS